MFNQIFTKLSVLFPSYFHLRYISGRIGRYLNLVGNSMTRSWEENRLLGFFLVLFSGCFFFFFSFPVWTSLERQVGNWEGQWFCGTKYQQAGLKIQPQGYVSRSIFMSFFFLSFLKLQQVCGYFLKECSAKVVPLAILSILRSCPRFENVPNIDMIWDFKWRK